MTVKYAGITCRGSYALGTACGQCERCRDERIRLGIRLGWEKSVITSETDTEKLVERIRAEEEVRPDALLGDCRDALEALAEEVKNALAFSNLTIERIRELEAENARLRRSLNTERMYNEQHAATNLRHVDEIARLRELISAHNEMCETFVGFELPVTYRIEIPPAPDGEDGNG